MSTMTNPEFTMPADIASRFQSMQTEQDTERELFGRLSEGSRPNEDERQAQVEALNASSGNGVMTMESRQLLDDLRVRKFNRVRDSIHDSLVLERPGFNLTTWHHTQPEPERIDHSFWWAETREFHPDHVNADFRDDGLHFTGGPTHHNGNLFNTSYGAVASFAINPERVPASASGRWISAPHIELFGGLDGYTGDDDIFTGDLWSKCWLHTRQTILQFGFGPTGPVPLILGEARDVNVLIFEENADRLVHVNLPGFKWMPAVGFGNANLANDIWAQIEVRFDIQLEGAGTLLWANPEVLLRTFQWPLNPL